MKLLITIFITYLFSLTVYPIDFYINNHPDSISILGSGNKIFAKIIWDSNAVNGQNGLINAEVKYYNIIPPNTTGGQNYSLSLPILLEPQIISNIVFNPFKVRIRIYADTTLFTLDELGTHIGGYKVIELNNFYYRYDWLTINSEQNYVEFYLDNISANNLFILSALNILMGNINEGDLSEMITDYVLVPKNKSAILNEGVSFISTNFYGIEVKGSLTSEGTETNPVNLDLWVEVTGDMDSIIQNNQEKFNSTFTYCQRLLLNSANASANNTNFIAIQLKDFSKSNFTNINLDALYCYDSNLKIESSHFNYGGFVYSKKSVVMVESCVFEFYNYESEHTDSYLYFKNNIINADVFHTIRPLRCLLIFEGNRIVYAGEPGQNGNKVGLGIWQENYAVIRNNIIQGFRGAIEVGYENKAVIYNNTLVYNNSGIYVYGTPDTLSIYNNIFINNYKAIDLDYSTYAGGTNLSYINNNLWKENITYHPLIFNNKPNSIIIGNDISFYSDPIFIDTISYKLSENSPAIDQGVQIIPAFIHNFEVIDTIIQMQGSITIDYFWGNFPDIGAVEYDPSVNIEIQSDKTSPNIFSLSQNYPNPFNPSTKIKFEIPGQARNDNVLVTLKIYDILGREVATLVNEEKPAGIYETEFNASNLSTGIYFYQLKAGDYIETKKMILVK
ncbi:MAG TPA: T9SS type A sorting domain-containing protein [Ignavibacteriaceae bacterium]|nr:T9SS type A sorting domain-containing protein [Ignavibacteriaceae bacterium]